MDSIQSADDAPPFIDSDPNGYAIIERLTKFVDSTGYSLIQKNGQRRYGPPPGWQGPPPPKGSEIFVGKIPRDCFEDEIVPAFQHIGMIYDMRLMMDFSGTNRGYCFITFVSPELAKRAVAVMDGFEIRPGRKIGVFKSVDNCRLFVGGIPLDKGRDEVRDELEKYVEGIVDVIMYPSVQDVRKNRGFVFVEFESHRLAAMARRKMTPGALILWDHSILVDWAYPEPDVDPDVMAKVSKLYIRNLNKQTTKEHLQLIMNTIVPLECVPRIHKIEDYAFIHLSNRQIAEFVKIQLEALGVIDGNDIEVKWARPRMYSKASRILMPETTYCKSLPPKIWKNSMNQDKALPRSPPPSYTAAVPQYTCAPPPQTPARIYPPSISVQMPIFGTTYMPCQPMPNI